MAKVKNIPEGVEILSFDDILNSDDVQYRVVAVEGWGNVLLGTLSAAQLIEYTESNEGPAKKTAGIRLVMMSICDKNGDRMKSEQQQKFMNLNAKNIGSLVDEVLDLNGLLEKKKSAAAVKNDSGEADNSASPTD